MFVGPEYGTCFLSLLCHLKHCDGCSIFVKFVCPSVKVVQESLNQPFLNSTIANLLEQNTNRQQWTRHVTVRYRTAALSHSIGKEIYEHFTPECILDTVK